MRAKRNVLYKTLKILEIFLLLHSIINILLLPFTIKEIFLILLPYRRTIIRVFLYYTFPMIFYVLLRTKLIKMIEYHTLIKYQTTNGCYSLRDPMQKITGIVIHLSDENNPYLKHYVDFENELGKNTENNHWNKKAAPMIPHGFIGYDKNDEIIIVNTLTYDMTTRICGNGIIGSFDKSPDAHIQIIICADALQNPEYFNNAVFGAAVQYCARLSKKFRIKPDFIVSDYEAYESGFAAQYSDFEKWLGKHGKTMAEFRTEVKEQRKREMIRLGYGLGEKFSFSKVLFKLFGKLKRIGNNTGDA